MPPTVQQKFSAALDALIEQVKGDRSVLAAILCGSLSHDTVWAKSDIDLVLVTIDDKKAERGPRALRGRGQRARLPDAAGGVPQDGGRRRSATRSCTRFWPRGGCSTPTTRPIAELCAQLHEIGERDTQLQLLAAATHALPPIYKAHKWFSRAATWTTRRCGSSTRRHSLAQDRGDRRAAAGRPRGDPAGDEAESRLLQDRLYRPAQHEEDAEERGGARWRRSTATWRSARRRCSRR